MVIVEVLFESDKNKFSFNGLELGLQAVIRAVICV